MKRWATSVVIVFSVVASGRAYAQEVTPGPGKVEVTVIPAGWTFFTSNSDRSEPRFGSYDVGAALSYNFNRRVGLEGEVGGSFGVRQHLEGFAGLTTKERTPNMLSYTGNVVFNATGHSVVPFVTAGIGGLTLYRRETLGLDDDGTFLAGNVGGGVKWFAPNGRWGVRGDYRFQIVRDRHDASSFFGQATRYGNRVYGGIIINAVR